MILLDASNAGQTVEIGVGQTAELRLAENVTTGYSWKIARDGGPGCRVVEDFAEPPADPKPGQGGSHVWRISGVQPGLCEVAMNYARPWENRGTPAKSFDVTIRVKP